MPRRKRHGDDLEKIRRKIRKLERELYRVSDDRDYYYSDDSDTQSTRHGSDSALDGDIYGDPSDYPPLEEDGTEARDAAVAAAPAPQSAPGSASEYATGAEPEYAPGPASGMALEPDAAIASPAGGELAPAATNPPVVIDVAEPTPAILQQEPSEVLDESILEILGADPTTGAEFGKDIHKQLATRLEHMATVGISNEERKELSEKYLIPVNCTKIGAPLMNAEIKAAVTDVVMKRDRGIEMRQKQIAAAISGLATVMTRELGAKDKDSERLRQLMDVARVLCDVQHSESVTRRNFAIYSIKKELKDHITNTKIDKYLFGEGLAETLKAAKAVSTSGTELKIKSQPGPRGPKPSTSSTGHFNHLNWRPRAPARRPQGPPRGREPAPPPPRFPRAPPHGNSSKTSQPPQRPYRRR